MKTSSFLTLILFCLGVLASVCQVIINSAEPKVKVLSFTTNFGEVNFKDIKIALEKAITKNNVKVDLSTFCFIELLKSINKEKSEWGFPLLSKPEEIIQLHRSYCKRYDEIISFVLKDISDNEQKNTVGKTNLLNYIDEDIENLAADLAIKVNEFTAKKNSGLYFEKINISSFAYYGLLKAVADRRKKLGCPTLQETVPDDLLDEIGSKFTVAYTKDYENIVDVLVRNLSQDSVRNAIEIDDTNSMKLYPWYKDYKEFRKIEENISRCWNSEILPEIEILFDSLREKYQINSSIISKKIKASPTLKGLYLGQSQSEVENLNNISQESCNKNSLPLLLFYWLKQEHLESLSDNQRNFLENKDHNELIKLIFPSLYAGFYSSFSEEKRAVVSSVFDMDYQPDNSNRSFTSPKIFIKSLIDDRYRNKNQSNIEKNGVILIQIEYGANMLVEKIEFTHEGLREFFNITDDMKLEFIGQQFVENVVGINELTLSTDSYQDYEQTFQMYTTKSFLKYSHQSKYGWEFSINQLEESVKSSNALLATQGRRTTTTRSIILRKTKTITF